MPSLHLAWANLQCSVLVQSWHITRDVRGRTEVNTTHAPPPTLVFHDLVFLPAPPTPTKQNTIGLCGHNQSAEGAWAILESTSSHQELPFQDLDKTPERTLKDKPGDLMTNLSHLGTMPYSATATTNESSFWLKWTHGTTWLSVVD